MTNPLQALSPRRREFKHIAADLLTEQGFPPERQLSTMRNSWGELVHTSESVTGQAYCQVVEAKPPPGTEPPSQSLEPRSNDEPFLLGGLLVNAYGVFAPPPSSRRFKDQAFALTAFSSPDGHNQAQQTLGRQPGINALRMTVGGTGEIPVGRITPRLG